MKELVVREGISLLDIPSGEAVYGIVLPTAKQLTKDGFGIATQKDTYRANRIFKIARKIGEYTTEYGARVFYLGTYTNPSGGKFRLFSFPVKDKYKDISDATIISESCTQLVSTLQKYKVDKCLLPIIGDDLGISSFANCIKPVLEVSFDDSFIMIHYTPGSK